MLLHQRDELAEEVIAIVRSGRGLGMVLHAEDGQLTMTESLIRSIVEIDMSDFNLR